MVVDKRRRKKSRIQAESSSDESDASVHDAKSESELSELSDVEEPHAVPEAQVEEVPRERLHKAPQNTDHEFSQLFLGMITEQFGEELAALRESKDFGPASITQLVAGLKQGADVFTPDQQRLFQK